MFDFFSKKSSLQIGSHLSKIQGYSKNKAHSLLQDSFIIREKFKDLAKTNYELGLHHLQKGNLYDAVLRFKFSLRLRPDFAPAYYNMGRALFMQGKLEKAEEVLLQALQVQSDYPEVDYILASLRHDKKAIEAIPLSIIADYFDDLAPTYNEEYIKNRHYVGHLALFDAIADVIENKALAIDVIDLGCGTGLCGSILRERIAISSLTGVDISEKMLREARKLRTGGNPIYDYLKHTDMLAYLYKADRKYDLITGALSFSYVGHLAPILMACKQNLRPNGLLAFSTEESPDEDVTINDTLQNFCHSLEYIREQATIAGFQEVSIKKTVLLENSLSIQCVLRN